MIFSRHSLEISPFQPCFDPHTYKVTTTTAQFTFYNCKLHFITAEIVISFTLKYALLRSRILQDNFVIAKYEPLHWSFSLLFIAQSSLLRIWSNFRLTHLHISTVQLKVVITIVDNRPSRCGYSCC